MFLKSRLLEQAPSDMEEQAVTWAKMVIPLLVHSAHKVQLKAASALEMGLPLLQQHQEVIAVAEQLLTTVSQIYLKCVCRAPQSQTYFLHDLHLVPIQLFH